MDEVTRLAMRRKHAERSMVCACGRRIYGNGRNSHLRACRDYLSQFGYPLDEGMRSTIRAEVGVGVVAPAEQRLGLIAAERLGTANDLRLMRWPDFRELVWQAVEEATPF